ncbi:MAG: tRNA (adenosine(37)-N6)-threonylcarbamoyltransferase complex dimerization subunit type 1 TsaB [Actinobacteria bacterium]|nr:tRNA (adenosine(37)-N6)-threonylcarbamoyltransferase complex dimerization subunit type 1 TsaB [Actinomycetota bacterium]
MILDYGNEKAGTWEGFLYNRAMYIGINLAIQPFSVGVLSEQNEFMGVSWQVKTGLSEQVMQEIVNLCDRLGGSVQDIKGITVIHGPGSYTGLRIGVTTAKSLAQTLSCPLYSLGTLSFLLRSYRGMQGLILGVIPGRRTELNIQLFGGYQGGIREVSELFSIKTSALTRVLSGFKEPVMVVAGGIEDMSIFNDEVSVVPVSLSSYELALYARSQETEAGSVKFNDVLPLYSHEPVTGSVNVTSRKE